MNSAPPTRRVPRAERKEQLLDVALGLIAREGFHALTMTAVARAADISKPIVYRCYPNLPALTLALLRREQRRAERQLDLAVPRDPGDRHPREVLGDAVITLLDAVAENPLTWRLVLLPPEGTPRMVHELIEARRKMLLRRARKLIAWGRPYLRSDEEIDLDVLARILISIAEQGARLMLTDEAMGRDRLAATTRELIDAIAWRDAPAQAA